MRYLGGKSRMAARIEAVVLAHRGGRTRYLEPFVGGGSVAARLVPHFPHGHATLADASPDLVLLWCHALLGGTFPETMSHDEWKAWRNYPEPCVMRAFAGFGMSFGGRWFEGFARDTTNTLPDGRQNTGEPRRSIARKAERMAGARVLCRDYRDFDPTPDHVIYCDPPYAGTKTYGAVEPFDHDQFWRVAQEWAELGALVLVSEYAAPAGWVPVWEHVRDVSIARTARGQEATERLYRWAPDGTVDDGGLW